jgi:Fe-S cluster biogenesis protein NfuA
VDDAAAREGVARAERLLGELEALDDPDARATALEAVQALVDLYGEGLARIVDTVGDDADVGERLAADELVAHLLLVHDLHPVDVEARVRDALAETREFLRSHGGDVELTEVREGIAYLKVVREDGCATPVETLRAAVEEAVGRAAPDLEGIEIDDGSGSRVGWGISLPVLAGDTASNGASPNGAPAT